MRSSSMKIKKITAKNFYSFKSLELDLEDYNGIVRITGKNKDSGGSNGSGKSSIFEAIVWGLFNKSIRKSTEESLVNAKVGRDCEVTVLLEKEGIGEMEIRRCKRPTSLTFTINAQNRNKESAAETQKQIEELLDTDYKSFMASVVFGQHSEISFLDSSPEDKRNIIKSCFNLEEFFSKRNAVKELKSQYTSQLKVWNTLLDSLKKERAALEKNIPDKKYKVVELPRLTDILQAERAIEAHQKTIKTLNDAISADKASIKKLDLAISKGVYSEDKECPVCKNSYLKCQTHDEVVKLEFEKKSFESTIKFNEDSIRELETKISVLKPPYSSYEWDRWNEKNKQVLEAQKHLDKLEGLIEQIKANETASYDLTQRLEVMKFWEMAFSEKGIVKYIVRNILDYFNLKSNEYASILTNNQFTIEFNDELSEVIRNNGMETKYISLSGGEKRKINLAIMLALQDLSSKISKTNCNLIFFDEVCDNIDDLGIGAINNLLNTLKNQYSDKVIFLITHNNLLNSLLSESQEVLVIKHKGTSKISHAKEVK